MLDHLELIQLVQPQFNTDVIEEPRVRDASGVADAADAFIGRDEPDTFVAATEHVSANSTEFSFDHPRCKPIQDISDHNYINMEDMKMLKNWSSFEKCQLIADQLELMEGVRLDFCESALPGAGGWGANVLSSATTTLSPYGESTTPLSSVDFPHRKGQSASRKPGDLSKTRSLLSNRTRKRSRKLTNDSLQLLKLPDDEKRRMSLEKNRLASAKCRIKKRGEMQQLNDALRAKATENTELKQQTMHMKAEILNLQSKLASHMSSHGYRRSQEVRIALDENQIGLMTGNKSKP